ncbi:DUF1648 domain-containing protein [uncultured Corynebacterium sp.]|uniref:DUF1648 domain-containing protein n=1 Tax=uncultured Corynebacterium sp. TaxID=159447 RepID=UPI0025D83C25|nr:DUF1648 domain-containing protein [uncultured Corynebacterium sp.]
MDGLTTDRGDSSIGRWDITALLGFVVAPLLGVAGVVAWVLTVRDRLPDPIATHFNGAGEADGFGDVTGILKIAVVMILPFILLIGLIGSWRGHPRILRRTIGPGSTVLTGSMFGLLPDTVVPQLDRASAEGVMLGSSWSIIGTGIGLAVGVATAVALRDVPSSPATSAPDPALPRGPRSEPVRTMTSTGMKVLAVAFFAAALASLFISVVFFLILLLSSVYAIQTYVVALRVDDDAVRLRALIGESIPLETITAARPARYDWGDSGGVGIRGVDYPGARGKRIAVASRSGEALDVDTTGTNWTFVVPDGTAEDLAGDINARLDRLHGETDDVR